jgi:hypothetical protein
MHEAPTSGLKPFSPGIQPIRWLLPIVGFTVLAVVLLAPLSLHPAGLARLDGDGQFSIWNIAWVAHALTTDPLNVWNANIFYPSRMTLAYSEANLMAGLLAAPIYALSHNPFLALNLVLIASFVLSALAMFALVSYLTGDQRAGAISGIAFAFCPFVFAHLAHIQLLMTAGLPLSLLYFHKLSDAPSVRRGIALGLALAAQTYACAYYGIFAVLLIGFSTLLFAALRRDLNHRAYWTAIAVAAIVSAAVVAPLALVYARFSSETGFARPIEQARLYSANPGSYIASAAYAHAWLLSIAGKWREVLFPGLVATIFGLAGSAIAFRRPRQSPVPVLYVTVGVVALWASFGPDAGLYRLLHETVPGFTFLRAPVRFGLIVQLALSVLAGLAIANLLRRRARPALWVTLILAIAVVESFKPLKFLPAPAVDPVYRTLAKLPAGGVLELPLYSRRFAFLRTKYMLASTAHWKPIVGGYSDYMPGRAIALEGVLGGFPTRESLDQLAHDGVRYAVVHRADYPQDQREKLDERLREFKTEIRPLDQSADLALYEVLTPAPPPNSSTVVQ